MAVFFDMRRFGFSSLARGVLPLWNPHVFCGTPFLAGMQPALFYPLNLVFFLLPVQSALSISILVHLIIAGSGMYLLVRMLTGVRLAGVVSAISYSFSGFYLAKILAGHLPVVLVMAWVPAVVICGEMFIRTARWSWGIAAGSLLALEILAGHPTYAILSALLLLLYVVSNALLRAGSEKNWGIVSKAFLFLGASMAVSFAVGAAQILPAMGLVGNTNRTPPHRIPYVTVQSFPPENLLTFLVPGAFGRYSLPWPWQWPPPDQRMPEIEWMQESLYWGRQAQWEVFPYFGVVSLILAASAIGGKRDRVFYGLVGVFLAGLLLAPGKYSPPSKWLFTIVARGGLFRCPGRFILLCVFAGSALAGLGTSHLLGDGKGRSRLGVQVVGILVVAGLAASALVLTRLYGASGAETWARWMQRVVSLRADKPTVEAGSYFTMEARSVFLRSAWTSWALAAGAALLVLAARRSAAGRRMAVVGLAVLSLGDLALISRAYVFGTDASLLALPERTVAFLKENTGEYRVSLSIGTYHASRSMDYGIAAAGGYDAFVLRRYSELASRNQEAALDEALQEVEVSRSTPISRLMGVKYFLTRAETRPGPVEPVFEEEGLALWEDPHACPRAFVVHEFIVEKTRERALDILAGENFQPRRTALLEEEPEMRVEPPERGESVAQLVDNGPNHVKVRARLASNGILVLTDTFYPGWRAVVDGKPWRIIHADWAFRGLVLPAGEHEIEFLFRPASTYVGAALTSVAILAIAAWGAAALIRFRRPQA